MIFFDEYHIFFTSWAFVSQLRLSSEELGNRLQTPTLIGCMLLMNSKHPHPWASCFYRLTVISEALYYYTLFGALWRFFQRFYLIFKKKRPLERVGVSWLGSLTMSYFHTGIRTIIGAEAFHCPVRDGKEWYHLAMVVRQNFLFFWLGQENQFIELISLSILRRCHTVKWNNNFECVNLA